MLIFWINTTISDNKGKLVGTYESPSGEFEIKCYILGGGATHIGNLRAEVQNTNTKKTREIYWCYDQPEANVLWVDNDVVLINGKQLNVLTDSYDCTKDKDFMKKYYEYHGYRKTGDG